MGNKSVKRYRHRVDWNAMDNVRNRYTSFITSRINNIGECSSGNIDLSWRTIFIHIIDDFFSNSYSLNLNCSAIHRGRLNQTSNSNEMQSMGISNKNGCRNVKAKVDFAFRSCEMNENNLLNFVIYLKT